MDEITKVNIEQLPPGEIQLTSKIMFGIGEFLHTDTVQNLLNLLGISTTDVKPRLVDLNITILEENLDSFMSLVSLTIEQGEIIFLRFFIIKDDGTLYRATYTVPLGSGTYSPLGSTIVFEQLVLINEEFTGVSGNANTITYSFANLAEINTSDPATDFSDSEKEYIVILSTTPYLFIGDLGFYGTDELTMTMDDLQLINVSLFNLQVNEEGETPFPNISRIEFAAGTTVEDLGGNAVKVTPSGGSTPSLNEVLAVGDRTSDLLFDNYLVVPDDRYKHYIALDAGMASDIEIEIDDDSFFSGNDVFSEYKFTNAQVSSDFVVEIVNTSSFENVGTTALIIPKGYTATIRAVGDSASFLVTYETDGVSSGSTPNLQEVLLQGSRKGMPIDNDYTLTSDDIASIIIAEDNYGMGADFDITIPQNVYPMGTTDHTFGNFVIINRSSFVGTLICGNSSVSINGVADGTKAIPPNTICFVHAIAGVSGDDWQTFSIPTELSSGGATDLGYTASPTDGTVTSSTGTSATIPLANGTNAGLSLNNLTNALKTAYDSAVTWITTNGTNLINHLSNTSNPHSTTASQVGAYTTGQVDTALALKADKASWMVLPANYTLPTTSTTLQKIFNVGSSGNGSLAVVSGNRYRFRVKLLANNPNATNMAFLFGVLGTATISEISYTASSLRNNSLTIGGTPSKFSNSVTTGAFVTTANTTLFGQILIEGEFSVSGNGTFIPAFSTSAADTINLLQGSSIFIEQFGLTSENASSNIV